MSDGPDFQDYLDEAEDQLCEAIMTTDPTTLSGEVERVRGAILRVKDRYSRYADIPTDELADEILQALRVEPPSDVAGLVGRLRAIESSNDDLGGDIGTNSYRNPDGPEAADIILSLQRQIAVKNEALRIIDGGGDVDVSDTAIIVGNGAAAVKRQIRYALIGNED